MHPSIPTRSILRPGFIALASGVALLCATTLPALGQGCCGGGATGGGSALNDFRDLIDRHTVPARLRITVFPSPSIGRVELRNHTQDTILFTLPVPANWTGAISTTVELPRDIHFSLSGFAPQSASGAPPVANGSQSGTVQQSSETAPPGEADEGYGVDPAKASCSTGDSGSDPSNSNANSSGTDQTGNSAGPVQSGSGAEPVSGVPGLAHTFSAAISPRAGNNVRVGLDMGVGLDGKHAPKLVFEADRSVIETEIGAITAANFKTALLRPGNSVTGLNHNTDGQGIGDVITNDARIVQMRTKTGLAVVSDDIPGGCRVMCYDYIDGPTGTLTIDGTTGLYIVPTSLTPVNVWEFTKVAVAGQPTKVSIIRKRGGSVVGNWSWTASGFDGSGGTGSGEATLRDEVNKTEEFTSTTSSSYGESTRIREKRTPTEIKKKVIWHHGPPITRPAPPVVTPPPAGMPPTVASAVNVVVTTDATSESVVMQGDSGYFKKKTFYPSASAPNRRISILRSWLGVTLPGSADEGNCDATTIDHSSTQGGWSRIWVRKLAGVQVEKVITGSYTALREFPAGGIPQQPVETVTQVRYLGGSTNPVTSVRETFAERADARVAGRPLFSVGTDGSTVQYEYLFGAWNAGTLEFSPGVGDYLQVERTRVAAGRTEREVTVENHDGTTLSRQSYRGVVGVASLLVSHDVYVYAYAANHSDWTMETKRKEAGVAGGGATWRTTHREAWSGFRQTSETDETGVATTFTHTDSDEIPDVETRAAIPAANGLPAVPARTLTRTWDTERVWQTETIKEGATTHAKRMWKKDSEGRILEETRNDALTTRYEYETVPAVDADPTTQTVGAPEFYKVRRFERAYLAAQSVERLISETTTDHLGRLVSVTGPGVVEERRSYTVLPNGQTREAVTRGSESLAAQQILTERIVDALGRTVREKVNVPGGVERSWEYDAQGRVTREELNSVLVRDYLYNGASITERAYPSPDPMRTTVRSSWIDASLAGSYEVERVQTGASFEERWTKLGLLAAGELGETKLVRNGGESITVKSEINLATRTVTEKRYRAGVANPDITESRAGSVLRTTNGAEGTVLTRTVVDALGRPKTELLSPQNRTTTYSYDYTTGGVASANTSASVSGVQTTLAVTQTYHPASDAAFGRVKTRTETGLMTNYVYSARGELLGTWGATYPVRYSYDLAGRLVKMETYRQVSGVGVSTPFLQWPAGDVTQWEYHPGTMALKQKKDAAGQGALYTYDPKGPLVTRAWARTKAGSTTVKVTATYAHNGLGELTGISYNDGTPAVALVRDDRGRIVSITEGGNARTFAYNAQGLLAAESSTGFNPHTVTRGYDAAGRAQGVVLETAAGGVATWQGWDYHAGTGAVAGLSMPDGHMAHANAPGTGRTGLLDLDGVTPQLGAVAQRGYDGFGRLETVGANVAVGSPVVTANVTRTYGYNALNQRESMSDERSDKWLYTYDGIGQVTGGTKKWSTNAADTGMFAGATVAGTVHSYGYDQIGNRTSWTKPGGSGNAGYVNNLNQVVTKTNGASIEVTGEADPAATVKVNTVLAYRQARGYFEREVGYSSYYGGYYGEWRTVNVEETKAGQSPTTQSSHVWMPQENETLTHDLDGNLTSDSRWSYTWDAENRLMGMETNSVMWPTLPRVRLTFTYDAHWRRVGKKVETKNASGVWVFTRELKYVYDRWNLIAEWEALPPQPTTFKLTRTHHWGPDLSGTAQGAGGVGGLVLTRNHRVPNGTGGFNVQSCMPAYDGNGNIMALLDIDTAEKAAEYEYGPFGEPLRATGPMARGNPFRFSTKYTDEETGLCYYGYRYYSANTGRWLGRDPIEEEGGSQNLYAFVSNNPTTWADYLGLYTVDVKTGTVNVGPCEIVLIVGHGNADKPLKWKFPNKCSAGGALTCSGESNNSGVPDGHGILGVPSGNYNGMFVNPNAIGKGWPEDNVYNTKPPIQRYNDVMKDVMKGIAEKAKEMCECCPNGLTIHIKPKGNGANWELNDTDLRTFPPQQDMPVDCEKINEENIDKWIENYYKEWKEKTK